MSGRTGAVVAIATAAVLSAVLTGAVRRYALSRAMLDMPNERSSHRIPTPRGGGLAIACVVLTGIAIAAVMDAVPVRLATALIGGGVAIAFVGWLDDRRGLPSLVRLSVHLAAAGWVVALLGVPTLLDLRHASEAANTGLAILAIAWCTNLYNFMDGIDGIAAGHAVVVATVAASLATFDGASAIALVAALVGASSAGFLVWNWSPARIFMGDVSSGLLGFLFGALAIASDRVGGPPAIAWILLLGAFLFDATVTLVRRALRGERWYGAHRRHAYQRLTQGGWSHARVSTAYVAAAASLGLLAAIATHRPEAALTCIVVAIGGLVAAYIGVERYRPMWQGDDSPTANGAHTPTAPD
jgi:Fuc2NAc and GlcNAc transferase